MGNCWSRLRSFFLGNSSRKQDEESHLVKTDVPNSYGSAVKEEELIREISKLKEELAKYAKNDEDLRSELAICAKNGEDLRGIIAEKQWSIDALINRLSKEMASKMSADESSVENVSIKARPMNIADDYLLACSQEWLTAKTALDEYLPGDMDIRMECVKLELLCDIMKAAAKKSSEHFQEKDAKMKEFLIGYANIKTRGEGESVSLIIPAEVKNALIDYLRNLSDDTNVEPIEEGTKLEIDHSTSLGTYRDLWQKCKDEESLNTYVSKLALITWKMVIQRPPMAFRSSEKWLGEKYQERHWSSEDTPDPVMVEVYPMLYHNTALMAKGKVLLVSKNKLE